jgi:hypothetical protein
MKVAAEQGSAVDLLPDTFLTAELYISLNYIFDKGKLDSRTFRKVKRQEQLVDELRRQGVTDPAVYEKAIQKIFDEEDEKEHRAWWRKICG